MSPIFGRFTTGSSLSPASGALSWGPPGAPSLDEEAGLGGWEVGSRAGPRQAKTRWPPCSAQGSEPARTLFSGGARPALPPRVDVCRRDVHPHGAGPTFSRSRVHTPPARMEGLVLENTLVSAHTPLTLSHTHVSCARVLSLAPVSSSLSHLLDCSLLLPRALLERGVILQVLTSPAQSTRAPHLPGLWPLYGR